MSIIIRIFRKSMILCWVLVFIVQASMAIGVSSAASEPPAKKILMLYSDTPEFLANPIFTDGFKSRIGELVHSPIEYSYEYLAWSQHQNDPQYPEALETFLFKKYRQSQPDLVVLLGGPAAQFLITRGETLFPGVPKIITGATVAGYSQADIPADTHLIQSSYSAVKAIEAILQLQPATKKIYVVIGDSAAERQVISQYGRDFQVFANRAEFIYLNQLSLAKLLETTPTIESDAVILFHTFFRDAEGSAYYPVNVLRRLAQEARVPIYSVQDVFLGLGAVGGYVNSNRLIGVRAAERGAQILNREKIPNAVLSAATTGEYLFDWRELKRWGIDEKNLPAGSRIEFKEADVWDKYKWQITGAAALIVVQGFLISALLINRAWRRKAQEELIHSKEEIESLYEETTALNSELNQALDEKDYALEKNQASLKEISDLYQKLSATYSELAVSKEALNRQYIQLEQQEQSLEESEERYRLATEGANDVIWDIDLESGIIRNSDRLTAVTGIDLPANGHFTLDEWRLRIHPDDSSMLDKTLREHLDGITSHYFNEYRVDDGRGGYVWVAVRGKAIFDETGKPLRMAGSLTNITEQKQAREQVEYLAYHDSLTGLPNRAALSRKFAEITAGPERVENTSLVLVDLDDFKVVNDLSGHGHGDMLLKQVTMSLKALVNEHIFLARFGGDEFVFIHYGNPDFATISLFAEDVLDCFKLPFAIRDNLFQMTASVGIALFPEHGQDFNQLLQGADIALHKGKRNGKNRCEFFDASLRIEMTRKQEMEKGLKVAAQNQELVLHYQPQFDLKDHSVVGFEALLRWNHPKWGMVPPLDFIPWAEETGLITSLGKWVLEEACFAVRRINAQIGHSHFVAVNISARQLTEPDFPETVLRILQKTGLAAELLELEITETLLLQSFDECVASLDTLRRAGIKVSLDDFGTGYSSLTYLQKLPVDTIKMDHYFIGEIQADSNSRAILASVINLSHHFGFAVVAEGLETEEQVALVTQYGCDRGQGYFLSRPVPEESLLRWLGKEGTNT
ncbi:MAG: EAL domain-containing protein [Negativicutes bacterium]|nr:EAL domain-containing protein [Negativicutes bacterium]